MTVTVIEAQILPRLQGSEPFQAVALGRGGRILSRPGTGASFNSTASPRLGRPDEMALDWQQDDTFILAYVVQGDVDMYAGKRRATCPAGTFAMVFPGTYRAMLNAPYWFRMTSANRESRLSLLMIKPGMVINHVCELQNGVLHETKALYIPDNLLYSLVSQLSMECGKVANPDGICRLLWLFYDRVRRKLREDSFLITRPMQDESTSADTLQNVGEKALRYVEANLMEKLTLESVARAIFSTRTRVARDFKAHTGMPLGTYLQHRRLEQARQLLTSTTDSIAIIARNCGFSDADYFSAAFRRTQDMTPSQYRAQATDLKSESRMQKSE